jgi:hypothetical protein
VGHRADIEGGLLERAAALDALGGFLGDARAGRGRLVFLHGEAGIGKSALLRRLRELHGGSARVLWGGCDAALTPRALGPLVDVAEQAGGELAALVGRAAPLHEIADVHSFGSAVQLPGAGDSPSDRGGSDAAVPATIRVVGPERTVVHDDVDAVPTLLASVALLVGIAGAGYTLVTVRSLRKSLFS